MAHLLTPPATKVHRPRGPVAGPAAYQTWSTRFYWRQATCAETGCEHHIKGWTTVLNEATHEGRVAADYIRYTAGRVFTEGRTEAGFTQFDFPAGQTCFDARNHQIRAERPPLYVAQAGDWRGTAGQPRIYDRGDQFADDLHTHTTNIQTARDRAGV